MGAVYKGIDVNTGQVVAVKLLPQSMAGQEGFRVRFDSEIETLRKLEHPNIVGLVGFGDDRGQLFYSMEFVDGRSIQDDLKQGKRFGWRSVVDIGLQLCRALKHAHDRGVIHRDIKPANIMLTDDGVAKLTDFGIARLYGNINMTMTGGPIGTATYMSPEQADGETVTNRSDFYALGGTFYAMLAGRPPFIADSLLQMLKMQRSSEPDPISRYLPDVPPELELVINNMLYKDPKQRMANAMVLARGLQGVADAVTLRETNAAGAASAQVADSFADPPTGAAGTMDRAAANYQQDQTGSAHPKTTVRLPKINDSTASEEDIESTASVPSEKGDTTAAVPDKDGDTTAALETDQLEETLASEAGYQNDSLDDLTLASQPGTDLDDQTMPSEPGTPDETVVASPTRMQQYADQDAGADTYDLNLDDSSENANSAVSRAREIAAQDPNNQTIRDGSVFITAEEASEYDRLRSEEHERAQPRIIPVRTILTMLLLIVGIPSLILYLRPASADKLYDRIIALDALSEESTSYDRENADIYIREFRRRFPDDERIVELEDLADELEIRSLNVPSAIQRMYRQAESHIRLEPEQALLMFESLVNLYNDQTLQLDRREQRYYDKALKKVDDLRRIVQQIALQEGAVLSKRLKRAEALSQKNPAVAKSICISVITLYRERSWASEFVSTAETLLASLPDVAPALAEEVAEPKRPVPVEESETASEGEPKSDAPADPS